MSKVSNIDDYRPHMTFPVMCEKCLKEWQAVFPVGTDSLECPQCHEYVPIVANKGDK